MTLKLLKEILAEEQLRLDLEEEWDVHIRWAKKNETPPLGGKLDDYRAWVHWDFSHPLNSATIVITRNSDSDYRAVIVHELLHIRLNKHGDKKFEKALDVITNAIVKG